MLQSGDVVAFSGGLAAGKTTFMKGVAQALGVQSEITSPTYTIISEYSGRVPLYHMDAYRLHGAEDFLALGVEELLYGDGICAIEWSERVIDAIPAEAVHIEIAILDENLRRFRIRHARIEGELE